MRRSLPIALLLTLVLTALAGVVGAQRSPAPRPRRSRQARRARPTPTPESAADAHGSFTRDLPCSSCHTPDGWSMGGGSSSDTGRFNHASTGFPLAGRHLRAGCTQCHAAGREVRRDCVSCHQDQHQGRLGADCSRCHTAAAWTDTQAIETHRLTRLPLTGMHAIADCSDCHRRTVDREFSAVPAECIACHEQDYRRPDVHPPHGGSATRAPFSRDCTQCHRTTSWSPAIIDASLIGGGSTGLTETAPPSHELRFPIRAGSHRGADCASCHEDLRIPAAVRCVGCHAHRVSQLTAQHVTATPGLDGRGCLGCHPGGIAR